MKKFDAPRVSITQEEYDQLTACREIVNKLWMIYDAYNFPKEMQEPYQQGDEYMPQSIRARIEYLMDFDDSE